MATNIKDDFFPLNRQIRKHWIYKNSAYLHIWVEMLLVAKYEPCKDTINNELIDFEVGDFVYGRTQWAERLNVSEQTLRTFIRNLVKDGMIILKSSHAKFSVYCIQNYRKFNHLTNQQDNQQQNQQPEGTQEQANQQDNQLTNQQPTSSQPAANHIQEVKEFIYILCPEENEFINTLKTVKDYPLDYEKDKNYYNILAERYPTLDINLALKDWAVAKLDKPIKPRDNPRSQINTWCKNAVTWGKNLKDKGVNNNGKPANNTKTSTIDFSKNLYKGTDEPIDESGVF